MRRFITLAVLLLCILATPLASFSGSAFQDKVAQALNPELRDIYAAASIAFGEKDFQVARQKYTDLQEKARSIGDNLGVGLGLAGLGAVHKALQQYSLALESFTEAVPFLRRSNIKEVEGLAYAAMGEVNLQLENPRKAIDAFDKALAIGKGLLAQASDTEKLAILLVRAEIFRQKGIGHERLAQFDEAVNAYLMAASDFESVGIKQMAAFAFWRAANFLRERIKKPSEAVGISERASDLFNELGDRENFMWTRLASALAYRELGTVESYKNSAKAFEDVLEAAKEVGSEKVVGSAHFYLADTYERLAELEKALTHYQAALAHDLKIGGGQYTNPNQVVYLYSKARIYRHIGRYEEAIESLLALLATMRERKEDDGEAEVLMTLAEIHSWLADPDTAIQYYKQALDLFRKTGSIIDQVNVLSALGEFRLSDKVSADESIEYFRTARKLLNGFKGLDLLTLFETKGFTEALAGKSLMDFAQEALSSFEEWPLMVAGNLYQRWGRVVGVVGNIDEAISLVTIGWLYHQALPPNRQSGFEQAKDLYFLGEGYRQKRNLNEALERFRSAEKIAGALHTPEIHWVYSGLARTYADLGDYENAIEYYKKGLAILESIHGRQGTEGTKIGVFAGALYAYHGLVPLLLDTYKKTGNEHYLHEAFHYTERLKARAFLEIFTTSRTAQIGGLLGALAAKEEKLRLEIGMLSERLQKANFQSVEGSRLLDRLEDLRKSLNGLRQEAATQNKPNAQVFGRDPATIGQVQNVLGSDTALLEYSMGDEYITLWIVTKDAVRHDLINVAVEPILERYLKTLREPLIGVGDISKHVALGKELYRLLLGKAQDYLTGKKQLIIAPDGPLYYLPFEALIESSQDDAKKYSTLADVPYLVKQFEISYIPSASVLVAQYTQKKNQKQPERLPLLAFGDPIYREERKATPTVVQSGGITNIALRGLSFDRLEFSGEEVRRIATVWATPPTSEHINLRDRASVERVKNIDLTKYRILHFATHAVLGDKVEFASQPALVLSQDGGPDKDNGLLQFSDILQLRLNADLVVLSACETGLGQLREGEGIIGLTRAFFYAGASSAIVSLWKVEDQSTALLMEKFYQHLRNGKDKTEALRQAKLEIIKTSIALKATGMQHSLAAPFFWAPFILAGDSGPMVQ